jgi:hypothetical protein
MTVGSDLKRTNKTSLLDEELIILDVLLDSSNTFESLLKENYASWHNLPYSHDLDIGALRELIDKLIGNGILRSANRRPGNKEFYGLTEAGGKLWEVERAPDWERYCTDSSTMDEDGTWILFVESPSITTAKAFMVCASDCLLYRFNPDEVRTITQLDAHISTVDWRGFQTVCSISVTTYPFLETHHVDWNEYENKRSWWRSLTELARFQVL